MTEEPDPVAAEPPRPAWGLLAALGVGALALVPLLLAARIQSRAGAGEV